MTAIMGRGTDIVRESYEHADEAGTGRLGRFLPAFVARTIC